MIDYKAEMLKKLAKTDHIEKAYTLLAKAAEILDLGGFTKEANKVDEFLGAKKEKL